MNENENEKSQKGNDVLFFVVYIYTHTH